MDIYEQALNAETNEVELTTIDDYAMIMSLWHEKVLNDLINLKQTAPTAQHIEALERAIDVVDTFPIKTAYIINQELPC